MERALRTGDVARTSRHFATRLRGGEKRAGRQFALELGWRLIPDTSISVRSYSAAAVTFRYRYSRQGKGAWNGEEGEGEGRRGK